MLGYFVGSSISSYLYFLRSEKCATVIINFYFLIFFLYVFHSATTFHHYLLLFLRHFFHTFLCLYQPYLCSIFHSIFRIFDFFFSSRYTLLNKFVILIYEAIHAIEIKISIVFNLVFASNTILSYIYLFFLIIDFYFLILAVIAQTFNPTRRFVIPAGTPTNEANAEIEIHPLTVEMETRKF